MATKKNDYEIELARYLSIHRYFNRVNGFGYRRGGPIEAVLRDGRRFNPTPRPKGMRKMANRECFGNAFKRVFEASFKKEAEQYAYAEGWALSGNGVICHHAWIVDKAGNAIETTWKEPGLAYFGIPLGDKFVAETIIESGTFGVLTKLDYSKPFPRGEIIPRLGRPIGPLPTVDALGISGYPDTSKVN